VNRSFGTELRRERERRGISLKTIADGTKISRRYLEALERNDVARWPSGIFRRSFIRAYAEAIHLDADAVVREFAAAFPDPAEPGRPAIVAPTHADREPLRLTLDSASRPAALAEGWRAAACDAALVLAVATLGFIVFGRFWMPLAVSALVYHLAGVLILADSPGRCLLLVGRLRLRGAARPPQSIDEHSAPHAGPQCESALTSSP
jgi:transcriptional regulator with XRE-family HTH domain